MDPEIYIAVDENAGYRVIAYHTLQKSAKLLHGSGISNAYVMSGEPSKLIVSYLEIEASGNLEEMSITRSDSPFEKEIPTLEPIYTKKTGFDLLKINAILKHSRISPIGIIVPKKAYAKKLEDLLPKEECKLTRLN